MTHHHPTSAVVVFLMFLASDVADCRDVVGEQPSLVAAEDAARSAAAADAAADETHRELERVIAKLVVPAVPGIASNTASPPLTTTRKFPEEPLLDEDYPNDATDGGLSDLWTTTTNTTTTTTTTTTVSTTTTTTPWGTTMPTTTTTSKTTITTSTPTTTTTVPLCSTVNTELIRNDSWVDGLFGSKLAPEGSPCVFGVDARDEGNHCILQGGKYGANGWCYTSQDASSWGACSAGCPLFGQAKLLSARVTALNKRLEEAEKRLIPALAAAEAKSCADCKDGKAKPLTRGVPAANAEEFGNQSKTPGAKDKASLLLVKAKQKLAKAKGGHRQRSVGGRQHVGAAKAIDQKRQQASAVKAKGGSQQKEAASTAKDGKRKLEKRTTVSNSRGKPQAKNAGNVAAGNGKEQQGSQTSWKSASFVQTAAGGKRLASKMQVDAATAFAQKAERQTELWAGIVERVLQMDDSLDNDDTLPLAQEALTKARAWQRIAGHAGARVNALMQVATE